ncbi:MULTISPECIES: hypothetical protein [unclassified Chelatococcus]|uniref:hypothetical protein n=1 Tax=unclassified Chelatococcus TaxID=2638111 RepID=UPI001BCB4C25|nr:MULTISPECIES: hypothetical protein [unclassified Chelatococcus]MBS7739492.1 hypothetical protein [Chelatococcus sp. HY11]MBX3543861.1 hypothetical protein [Chelatococcus sp.]MCO5075971.1 hypothetical protein [Chelatococcus sp.]
MTKTLFRALVVCAGAIVTTGSAAVAAPAQPASGGPAFAQFDGPSFDTRQDSRERFDRRNTRERDFDGRDQPSRFDEPRRGDRRDARERDFIGRDQPARYDEPRRERLDRRDRQRPLITITPPNLMPFGRDRGRSDR